MKGKVAILGRPNVGKSTLFNRIAKKRIAITLRELGTTRDRLFAQAEWKGVKFIIIDTGGYIPQPKISLEQQIKRQIEFAIKEAELALLMVNGKQPPHPVDYEIATILRKFNKNCFLVINKIDAKASQSNIQEFYSLGIKDIYPISAEHGTNVAELLDDVLEKITPIEDEKESMKLLIIGRPNVGKSTLLNKLTGEERAIVEPTPGTTIEPLTTMLIDRGMKIKIVDTPGIQKKSRIRSFKEFLGQKRIEKYVKDTDIIILIMDLKEPSTRIDKGIVGWIMKEGKGLVIALNKIDLIPKKELKEFENYVHSSLAFAYNIPVVPISALTGDGIEKLKREVITVYGEFTKQVDDRVLNEVFSGIIAAYPPKKGIKISKITQRGIKPPSFLVKTNKPEEIDKEYKQYIKNRLKSYFGFKGVDIKIDFRKKL